jgi:hypothetical protein
VGRNLSINPLYAGPYGILVSNVNFGAAAQPYGLSGAAPKVSSFFTFWNVKVGDGVRVFAACVLVWLERRRKRHTASTGQHTLLITPPLVLLHCNQTTWQADRPLPAPRAMYGPRMTWVGASLGPFAGLNAT